MPRPFKATLATLMVLALAGCGSSSPTATVSLPTINFKSVAIDPSHTGIGSIPSLYTCDGKDTTPPLEWGPVPVNTAQLVLFVLGLTQAPVTHDTIVSVEWALAGINPALHHLDTGKVPRGAFAGVAASGKGRYSICPKHGTNERYLFELYALPRGVVISPNFAGAPVLNALANSGRGSVISAHGSFAATYKRI